MVKRFSMVFSLALMAALLLSLPQQATAGVLAQALYQTPTPGPDGRIIYVVKAGETCLSISLMTGVSLEQLRSLNNLKAECVIRSGQQLLLGLAGPVDATATPGPAPTATPVLPSATPFIGTGEICIVTFEDVNGSSVRDPAEKVIPDSAISVSDRSGKVSLTGVTTSADAPVCFKDVLEGEYNISVAVPQGYNPTTVTNTALQLKAGDQVSQKSAPPPTMTTPLSTGGETQSPLLGIIGILLLLIGGGLGVYVWRMKKS
jgi:LPXTG-motif cell wall-anchored protein